MKVIKFNKGEFNFEIRFKEVKAYTNKLEIKVTKKETGEEFLKKGRYSSINRRIYFDKDLEQEDVDTKFAGVIPPESAIEEIEEITEKESREKNRKRKDYAKKIIDGDVNVSWKKRGDSYIPYIKDLPDFFYSDSDILDKALQMLGGWLIFDTNEYLRKSGNIFVGSELPKAFNVEKDNGGNIIKFDMKFTDCVDLESLTKEKERREKEKEKKERYKNSFDMEILEKGKIETGDGVDLYAEVKLTDKETGESLCFNARNIFDVGYLTNPSYAIKEGIEPGGIESDGKWQIFQDEKGWVDVRELTDFEKRCIEYLEMFPPIMTDIRL